MTNKRKEKDVIEPKKCLENRRIDERPETIEERVELGHWEMDCIKSARGQKQGFSP